MPHSTFSNHQPLYKDQWRGHLIYDSRNHCAKRDFSLINFAFLKYLETFQFCMMNALKGSSSLRLRPYPNIRSLVFLAAAKQLYEWFSPSVRLSVCLSVCLSVGPSVCPSVTPFSLWSHHHNISGVINIDRKDSRFRTITPVWIHIWRWYDTQSLMMLRRGALLFFSVIHQISRSHG